MQQLERDYVFEFAGMPQGGKTTIMGILAHYLKRMEYPFEEYHGGSRYSLLYNIPIAELNLWLAYKARDFIRDTVGGEKTGHKIYLLDRGLIDRCIFTDALVQSGMVSQEEAKETYRSLTSPWLLEKLDGVFIFITSPKVALEREYRDKLVKREDVRSEGEVMNEDFLSKMQLATKAWYNHARCLVKNVERIDTEQVNDEWRTTAKKVFDHISRNYPELDLKLYP